MDKKQNIILRVNEANTMVKLGFWGESMLLSRMKIKKRDLIILSYVLSNHYFVIVYLTVEPASVYESYVYTISIISSTTGIKRALYMRFSGLLVGPVMPMNVEAGIRQDFFNWFIRLVIYIIIATVIGFFADYYRKEFEINKRKEEELADAQYSVIYSLVKLAESRDDNTGAHIERVALFSKIIAEKLGNSKVQRVYKRQLY